MTIGIVFVAFFAALTAGVAAATRMSTLRATSSLSKRSKIFSLVCRPAVLDRDGLAIDPAKLAQTLHERLFPRRWLWRTATDSRSAGFSPTAGRRPRCTHTRNMTTTARIPPILILDFQIFDCRSMTSEFEDKTPHPTCAPTIQNPKSPIQNSSFPFPHRRAFFGKRPRPFFAVFRSSHQRG